MKIETQNVYHYTSLDTLFKLLDGIKDDNFVFYATRISELNDTSELIYGFKRFWEYLPILEKELHINENEYKLSQLASEDSSVKKNSLPPIVIDGLKKSRHIPYVISFSNNKDSLPMWNMYANSGYGVSLGFKMQLMIQENQTPHNTLLDLTAYDPSLPFSLKVSYGNLSKKSIINRSAKVLYSRYYKFVVNITDKEEIIKRQLSLIEDLGIAMSVLIKHPSYSYERESRYFCKAIDENSIKFRSNSKGNIIPYVEVEIPTSMFKKIVIGPCRNIGQLEDIIRLKLKQKGLNAIQVERSKIPYRDY